MGRGSRSDLEAEAKQLLNVYVDCLYVHVDALATGTGEPAALADRAVAYCENKLAHYCAAARDYLVSVAKPVDRALAEERAKVRCAETRDESRASLEARVVEQRKILAERLERGYRESGIVPPFESR